MNKFLTKSTAEISHDFYQRAFTKLYDAAQAAITEMRYGRTDEAEHILLRAGIEDPDGEPKWEPDRKDES